MAKTVGIGVEGGLGWGAVVEGEVSWLRVVEVSEKQLVLHLLTNFGLVAREAKVVVSYPSETGVRDPAAGACIIEVSQCESGYYPDLSLSETFYIRPGTRCLWKVLW